MRVISIVNQKGGCGKTTTAVNLSDCLALHHKRVLLIDLDPQSNATLALGIEDADVGENIYDALCGKTAIQNIIREPFINLYLAPSRITLSAAEQFLSGNEGREKVLAALIEPIKNNYDFIIIDCPPSMGLLTFNALMASTEAIIPIEPSSFSMQGLGRLLGTIELMQEQCEHKISYRALTTIFDRRTKFSWEIIEEIKRHFGERMFSTKIHASVRLKEAARAGKPICRFDTRSLGSFDYDALAKEIVYNELVPENPTEQSQAHSPRLTSRGVEFTCFAPHANHVELVGDFNEWKPNQIQMETRKKNGVWHKTLLLPQGKYQYRFIIDGEWIHDQNNEAIEHSPYGGVNSVVNV